MKIKKLEIHNNKEKKKMPAVELKRVLEKGSSALSEGVSAAKHGAISASQGIVKMAETVGEKSKEVQMNVLTYVDKKKNARFLKAKLSAFEDGLKVGKCRRLIILKNMQISVWHLQQFHFILHVVMVR